MTQLAATRLEVEHVNGGGECRLLLRGEVDLATVSRLVDALREAESRSPALIIVDARELTFIDARGIKVLLDAARRARRESRTVKLLNPTPWLTRILRMTAIDHTLDIVAARLPELPDGCTPIRPL